MIHKRQCAKCAGEGFLFDSRKPEYKRCFDCNAPRLNFGFWIGPAEGVNSKDILPDEVKAIAAEAAAEYMTAAVEFLDRDEIAERF